MSVRVMVTSDRQVPRQSTSAYFRQRGGFEVLDDCPLEDIERCVEERKPDVVLIIPTGTTTLDASEKVAAALDGNARFVIMSYSFDPEDARQALRAGATGYVIIDESMEDLCRAVELAAEGTPYLSTLLGSRIAQLESSNGLSGREREVLKLIALGWSSEEIAEELHISTRTVETHRSHINQKLGAHKRRELVSYAIEHQMIP